MTQLDHIRAMLTTLSAGAEILPLTHDRRLILIAALTQRVHDLAQQDNPYGEPPWNWRGEEPIA
jgi:hypothetical protein